MKSEATPTRKALLALGISSSLLASAFGANVPNPASNDIYIGFRATEGVGASESYVIKVGTYSALNSVSAGTTITLSLGDPGADLTAKYGSSWSTRDTLRWGAFGIGNNTNPTPMGSRERPSPSVQSSPWSALASDERQTGHNAISSLLTYGYAGKTATTNSTTATFQLNTAGPESYNYQVANGTLDFSVWENIEGSFSSAGPGTTALDLYRFTTSGVTYVGYFTISSSGAISFTKPGAAPSNVDTDGDGQLDSAEAIAGTSPTNAADFFQVKTIATPAGQPSLGFVPAPNRTYVLQYSEALALNSWINTGVTYSSPAVPPSTYILTDNDPVRNARSKGFYRISVSQNP